MLRTITFQSLVDELGLELGAFSFLTIAFHTPYLVMTVTVQNKRRLGFWRQNYNNTKANEYSRLVSELIKLVTFSLICVRKWQYII